MVRRRILALLTGAALVLGGLPAGAPAQGVPDDLQPPVDPVTDQYRESTPGERGRRRLAQEDRRALQRDGANGAALVTAVEGAPPDATGPTSAAPGRERAARVRPAEARPAAAVSGDAARPDRVEEASLGPVDLWLVLVVLAVLGTAGAVVRWRRAS